MTSKSFATFFKGPTSYQLILLVILAGIFVFLGQLKSPENNSASLLMDLNGNKRAFQGEITDNMTVFDAIQASVLAGNIKMHYLVENNNIVITQLSDYRTTKNHLAYYLNSNPVSPEQLADTPVRAGDKIIISAK